MFQTGRQVPLGRLTLSPFLVIQGSTWLREVCVGAYYSSSYKFWSLLRKMVVEAGNLFYISGFSLFMLDGQEESGDPKF